MYCMYTLISSESSKCSVVGPGLDIKFWQPYSLNRQPNQSGCFVTFVVFNGLSIRYGAVTFFVKIGQQDSYFAVPIV